jgi:hypothetical protein
MVRAKGVEPLSSVYQTDVLPLNDTRMRPARVAGSGLNSPRISIVEEPKTLQTPGRIPRGLQEE